MLSRPVGVTAFIVKVKSCNVYTDLENLDQLGTNPSRMLLTYSLMSTQGYDLNLYGLPVPANWPCRQTG